MFLINLQSHIWCWHLNVESVRDGRFAELVWDFAHFTNWLCFIFFLKIVLFPFFPCTLHPRLGWRVQIKVWVGMIAPALQSRHDAHKARSALCPAVITCSRLSACRIPSEQLSRRVDFTSLNATGYIRSHRLDIFSMQISVSLYLCTSSWYSSIFAHTHAA